MVVRTDIKTPKTFRASKDWKDEEQIAGNEEFVLDEGGGQKQLHSFSGYERNCLFLNRAGKQFTDVSLISGLDNIADGRTFVYWDYDRDGWQDIALVNANSPLLNFSTTPSANWQATATTPRASSLCVSWEPTGPPHRHRGWPAGTVTVPKWSLTWAT